MPRIARTRTAAAQIAQQEQGPSSSTRPPDKPLSSGKQRKIKRGGPKDVEVQVISCGELGHTHQLCRSETSARYQMSTCEGTNRANRGPKGRKRRQKRGKRGQKEGKKKVK